MNSFRTYHGDFRGNSFQSHTFVTCHIREHPVIYSELNVEFRQETATRCRKLTFNQCRDIVSLSILIGSGSTRRVDMPPSNRNLFMKIYCIRHYRILFLRERPAERNHLIQFPFCIHHTRCLRRGTSVFV